MKTKTNRLASSPLGLECKGDILIVHFFILLAVVILNITFAFMIGPLMAINAEGRLF